MIYKQKIFFGKFFGEWWEISLLFQSYLEIIHAIANEQPQREIVFSENYLHFSRILFNGFFVKNSSVRD
jgi:hypothetical protein